MSADKAWLRVLTLRHLHVALTLAWKSHCWQDLSSLRVYDTSESVIQFLAIIQQTQNSNYGPDSVLGVEIRQ